MHLHFKFHENPAFVLKMQKIYIKSTILNLEKNFKFFRNIIFVYIKHVKFKKASVIINSNQDIRQWNKKFWIISFTLPNTCYCKKFKMGIIWKFVTRFENKIWDAQLEA